ncbi:MAG: alpha/beta fold hydrolase [Acidimicrobiales bacterium]
MGVDLPVLVLHDVGDEDGGARWAAALEEEGWRGTITAPNLPGHCGEAPPEGGNYEMADAVWSALPLLDGTAPPVIVGIGANGFAAQLLALGGRAAALVLVDGLGGPWQSATEWVDAQRIWLRAVADDEAAMAGAPLGGLDPRLRHGVLPVTGRRMAEQVAEALAVPTLVLRSPHSPLDAAAVALLAARFADATSVVITDRTPDAVAAAILRWANSLA